MPLPVLPTAAHDLAGRKVLLINPPWRLEAGNAWTSVASCYPSLGLALIAAYLERCRARVQIIDMQAESGGPALLERQEPPDFVGITATTVIAAEAYQVSRLIRSLWTDVKIVLGGVHASIAPQEVLNRSAADFVIRGEGERSMAALVAGAPLEQIKGLAAIRQGVYWEHPELDWIEDLNEMPMPSYHLLRMRKYHPPLGGALRQPSMSIISTRGCPGRCTFCNSALSRRLRFRSAENVVREVRYLVENHAIREIGFYDDTFMANRQRVQQICALLLAEGIDVTWTCMSRINFADPVTLKMMAKAGCHMICYGVESADEEILKNIRKGIRLADVRGVVRMTQRAGITTRLSFMLGNPGETLETMQKTLRFALDVDPDLVQFNITTPYPGTEMYRWADERGYLLTKDWSKYDLSNVVMRLPTVSPEQITRFFRYANRRFYLRPKAVVRQLLAFLKNPAMLSRSLRSSLGLLKTILTHTRARAPAPS